MYTLGEASKATGISKSALSKSIAKGRISATKDDAGRFQIDPSELHRVYPVVNTGNTLGERMETPVNGVETRILEAKLEATVMLLEQVKSERDEIRKERDEWRKQATALLSAPVVKIEKKGFFARIFGL